MNAYATNPLRLSAVVALIVALTPPEVSADTWSFQKIADTGTSIPGGSGNFTLLEDPRLDNGDVGFRGEGGSGQRGIYTRIGGVTAVVANTTTSIPSGAGSFTEFFNPSFGGGKVAFTGFGGGGQSGIYTNVSGSLTRLADENTAIPSGTGNFTAFGGAVSTDGTDTVFIGDGSAGQNGIYGDLGGGLTRLYDTGTSIPSGSGNFAGYLAAALWGGKVAFSGTDFATQQGIYTDASGVLTRVADLTTAIPGGSGSFTGFLSEVSFDAGKVVFGGTGTAQEGIYSDASGALAMVADLSTAIPDGSGNFTSFARPTISDGNVGFTAFGSSGQIGIYTDISGSLMKVIDLSDMLDGKTIVGLSTSGDALDGNQLAFRADFNDGSSGLFLATIVPEPSGALLLLAGGIGLAIVRTRRHS